MCQTQTCYHGQNWPNIVTEERKKEALYTSRASLPPRKADDIYISKKKQKKTASEKKTHIHTHFIWSYDVLKLILCQFLPSLTVHLKQANLSIKIQVLTAVSLFRNTGTFWIPNTSCINRETQLCSKKTCPRNYIWDFWKHKNKYLNIIYLLAMYVKLIISQ